MDKSDGCCNLSSCQQFGAMLNKKYLHCRRHTGFTCSWILLLVILINTLVWMIFVFGASDTHTEEAVNVYSDLKTERPLVLVSDKGAKVLDELDAKQDLYVEVISDIWQKKNRKNFVDRIAFSDEDGLLVGYSKDDMVALNLYPGDNVGTVNLQGLFSAETPHSAAHLLNMIDDILVKLFTNHSLALLTINHPLQMVDIEKFETGFAYAGANCIFLVVSLVITGFSFFLIQERITKVRYLHCINCEDVHKKFILRNLERK